MSDSLFNIWINILTLMPGWIPESRLWLAPIISIALGILVGILVEKLTIGALRGILKRTSIALNNEIAQTLRGVIMWVFGLWGVYMATYVIEGLNAGMVDLLRKIIGTALMIIVIKVISQVAVALVRFYMNRSRELQVLPNTSIFENIIRGVVYSFGLLMLLQTMGISIGPLITALGIGGLAVSLALRDTLENMFAGINMILSRQIRIGSYVKLEGPFEGTIQDIGWRYTTLRTATNKNIVVPNSKMATNIVSAQDYPALDTIFSVTITYDSDMAEAERIAQDVANEVMQKVEGGEPRMASAVRFNSFLDEGIRLDAQLFPRLTTDPSNLRHEYVKSLYQRFQQAGIKIAYIPLQPVLLQQNGNGYAHLNAETATAALR